MSDVDDGVSIFVLEVMYAFFFPFVFLLSIFRFGSTHPHIIYALPHHDVLYLSPFTS
jgi:hypothetical protein